MKKLLAILLCMSMIIPFGACSSSKPEPISLNADNIEEFLDISSSVTYESDYLLGRIFSGYNNFYHLKFSPKAGYVFDNLSFDIKIYAKKSDFGSTLETINGKECYYVCLSKVNLKGNNFVTQTYEADESADDKATTKDFFYVLENIEGTVLSSSNDNNDPSYTYTIKDAISNTCISGDMFDEIEDNYAKLRLHYNEGATNAHLNDIHLQLGFTKGLVERMLNTRVSDGQLSEENSNYRISWSYSDDVLTIIYEMK